ncbi:MAG: LysR substrate-binding domain-containing protein, partial [Rubrimonas sp.]
MTQDEGALVRRGLKLAHLRLAAALAETGGVGAAGAAMGLTQPAASRLAAEIETIIGARLYRRHPRGVTLTDEGAMLAARAQIVLATLRDAERDLAAAASGGAGAVAVGAVTAPAVDLLAPALHALRATHPDIAVTVQVETSRVLMRGLESGALDFFLGRIPDDVDPAEVEFHPIGPERAHVCGRPDHPLMARATLAAPDLAAFDWVMQPRGSPLRLAVETLFMDAGAPVPPRLADTSSLMMTVALVAGSQALTA